MTAKEVIKKLTIEEKAALLSGKSEWESRDIKRLNINSIFFSDGPHGLRCQKGMGDHLGINESLAASCFPTAATVANSWDSKLGEEIGEALGEEALAQDVNVILGPGLNMKRSPFCGRNFEYFSEDPILAGKMAAGYIKGIQSKHVYACAKHFAVNSREARRMTTNSLVDERTLREIYLTGFEIAVKEGGVKSIMSSYNEVNGSYSNENKHLLVDILREEWGFDGIVVTDWGASNDHTEGVKCQSNVEMPNPGLGSARELLESIKNGRISEEEIDRAIYPVIEAAIYFTENKKQAFDIEAHHKIAKKAAMESAVLLKNEDSILPLKKGTKVALRGPFVKKPRYQGAGSSQVNSTKLDTIENQIGNYKLQVVDDLREAQVVLFFFGLDEIAESEGGDRYSIDIPKYQIDELMEISSINPNVIGILSAGSSVSMPWLSKLKGLLHGYLAGQAGASALLEIITGNATPCGKLSESYPFDYKDCSIYNYASEKGRNLQYREGPFIGYRYYDTANVKLQFPFGFGLSYTSFEYSDLKLTDKGLSFVIKNTGAYRGAEIAQLYIGLKDSALIRPKKELKGFKKVWLDPGQSLEVNIAFDDKSFRYFNTVTNSWEIEAGSYEIMVGASLLDIRLSASLYKEGTTDKLPYDINKLPNYKCGKVWDISKDEFELLYGKPLPKENEGELLINDPLCNLKNAKGLIGRLLYRKLQKKYDEAMASGIPDLTIMFIYNMPFRAIGKMTSGSVSMDMAKDILLIANGHFFKGLASLMADYPKNKKANKKYEELLK